MSRAGSSLCGSMPMIASGNSTPVSTTRNSEMPSTPRCQEMPHCSIHGCFDTNWKPPSSASNSTSSQTLIAPVATEVERGDELDVLRSALRQHRDDDRSGRRQEDQHREDRECRAPPCPASAASSAVIGNCSDRGEETNADERPARHGLRGRGTQIPRHHSTPRPMTNQASSSTTPSAEDGRVVAHVAGLAPADDTGTLGDAVARHR